MKNKEKCEFCEKISTYNNACEDILRGFGCRFVGTKTYWINRAGVAEKRLKTAKQENKKMREALKSFYNCFEVRENAYINPETNKPMAECVFKAQYLDMIKFLEMYQALSQKEER